MALYAGACCALVLGACADDGPGGAEVPCVTGDPWCEPHSGHDSAVVSDGGAGSRADGSVASMEGGQASGDA